MVYDIEGYFIADTLGDDMLYNTYGHMVFFYFLRL